jgi:hypothetical protein
MHLLFLSGWEKGPVMDWYNNHRSKGSTAITRCSFTKITSTRIITNILSYSLKVAMYTIDRRPDPGTPFNMIMKKGCTVFDMIQELHSTSLVDEMSDCVVKLHWQGNQTINLLFILSFCFGIHSDRLAKRYTLQHYNCYFVLWTIIMLAAQNTVGGAKLNAALEHGVSQDLPKGLHKRWLKGLHQNWLEGIHHKLSNQQRGELGKELGEALGEVLGWELGWELDRA